MSRGFLGTFFCNASELFVEPYSATKNLNRKIKERM